MTNQLLFAKVRENAIIPTKREEDAGYDIYPCPREEDGIGLVKGFIIPAHSTKLIPTGIASAFSSDYYIQIEERGSTGAKGIKKSAGVIDSGYRDEWFIAISNVNDKDLIIADEEIKDYGDAIYYPLNKAIAQAVVLPVPKMEVSEIGYDELKNIKSERGMGKLGDSGK
jgi:dUTP pyrophosphatase